MNDFKINSININFVYYLFKFYWKTNVENYGKLNITNFDIYIPNIFIRYLFIDNLFFRLLL